MKRVLSALLALLMVLSLGVSAFAADESVDEASADPTDLLSVLASSDMSSDEFLALLASFDTFDTSAYTPLELVSPDNDMRTDLQYSYVMDDMENIYAYSHGVEKISQPRGVICDFSGDGIAEADYYIIQRSSSEDFSDAVTVEGLTEKSYAFQNLLLGEHFYWRGGTSLDSIGESPVHEMTVTDIPPRVCYVDGVQNVRDMGGYESSLVPGAKLRQGLFYRGATLNDITEEGQIQMRDELGVRVEIDMRDESWCEGPYVEGVEYYVLPVPSWTEERRFEEFSAEYRQVFELVANADEMPVYLHCNSGADRTGLVVVMLLAVCGVGYDDIARDYLFSNFTDQRIRELSSEFVNWWAKLDYFAGDTKAEQAKNWLRLKGVSEADIEHIREIFVEGYVSDYVPETAKTMSLEDAEYQILAAMQNKLEEAFGDKVDDARIYVEKIYSEQEEQEDELIASLGLGPDEYAFEVRYELHPAEGVDVIELLVGNGEYDEASGWVAEKYAVGILRPNADGDPAYIITDFGTGF